MGNFIRRPKRSSGVRRSDGSRKKHAPPPQPPPPPPPPVDLEAEAVSRLRGMLRTDLEMFVLDHLLMSVQFFENFEAEMAAVCAAERGSESCDLAAHSRHCVAPDRLLDAVDRHVQFRPQHGPRKHRAETLAARRLFVVQDNVELCPDLDNWHYSSVDGPNYCFAAEPSRRQGYMRLRCDESIVSTERRTTYEEVEDSDEIIYDEPIYGSNIGASDSSVLTDDEVHPEHKMIEEFHYQSQDIIHLPDRELQSLEDIKEEKKSEELKSQPIGRKLLAKKRLQAKCSSLPDLTDEDPKRESDSSSGYKSGGSSKSQSLLKLNTTSEYSYSTIKGLNTPRRLAECTLGRIPANSSEIPNECFQRVITKVLDSDDQVKKLFENQYFLNSDMFMCNFVDLFSTRFATILEFNEESVEMATKVGAKIMCDKYQGESGHLLEDHYEVIPTLHCNEWPGQAKEWLRRIRNTTFHKNCFYTWPTQLMVNKVKAMGYSLLPIGHMLKKGDRPSRQIEWQLAFPEAERYLQPRLSHSLMRCYLFVMTLYKNFMKPRDTQLGLLPSHIRTLIFWQCEEHFTLQPDDQPGTTMRKFIEKIYNALQEKKLEDYFVRKRNLLDSTPDEIIYIDQERVYRINEHLLLHTLMAIRNLRFKSSSFYPLLNYKKLYQIVTQENLVMLNNPTLARTVSAHQQAAERQREPGSVRNLPVDMWQGVKMANPHQKFAEKAHKHLEQKSAAHRQMAPRGSTESIDINQARIRKGAEPLRRMMLLELFIPHFIEMAKASNRFRATKQAQFYLQQAERLAKLLEEEPTEVDTARAFRTTVDQLRQASYDPIASKASQPDEEISPAPPRGRPDKPAKQLFIRTQRPLPTDTVQHPEIDHAPLVVTLAQVHSQHTNAAQVAGSRGARPVMNLPDVPEQEYDEILPDREETSL